MIYRVVFQLMHRLTLGEAVVLAVVVAVLAMWGRSQDRRASRLQRAGTSRGRVSPHCYVAMPILPSD
jgi:hypothetical protein